MPLIKVNKKIGFTLVLTPIFLFILLNTLYPLPDPYQHGVATVVLDKNGETLRRFPNKQGIYREQINLEQVSPFYIEALLNYEDRWFYYHPGVNPFAMIRASFQWIINGHVVSGGSTITMQVARLISPNRRSILGKLHQIFRAIQLEVTYSKSEILTLYLNLAPFGGNIEGLKAASLKYLNKAPDQLNKSEAALLVVLPQRPSIYRPDKAPALAKEVRNKVLHRIYQAGLINENELYYTQQEKITASDYLTNSLAPLLSRKLQQAHSEQAIINTTIDGNLQLQIQNIFQRSIQNLSNKSSMAALVLRNSDAAVLAYRGSVSFQDNSRFAYVDMVNAIRSPGSTLKPFVYGLALQQGIIHSESLLSDIPTSFHGYKPTNLSGIFHGPVSASQALKLSLNVPAVQLLNRVSPKRLISTLTKDPITLQYSDPNLSIALGGIGTNLWSLAALYRSLAMNGQVKSPYVYIKSPGETKTGQQKEQTLLTPEASWIIFKTLSSISAQDRIIPSSRREIAWKTGTSYGYRDFWSIGVSADYTVAVWAGRPDSTPVIGYLGATQASPLMFDIFDQLPRDKQTLIKPKGVTQTTICWPGGLDANLTPLDKCQSHKKAYTINGRTPPSMDSNGLFMTHNSHPTELSLWIQKNKKYFNKTNETPIKIYTLKTGQHYFKQSIDQLNLKSNKDDQHVDWYINDTLSTNNIIDFTKLEGNIEVSACLDQVCDNVEIVVH